MALYRHVRGKDDLLDGVRDLIVGEIERPPPGDDWKASLRGLAMAARNVMLRHPWARQVLEERGTSGPTALAHIEAVLGALQAGGFSIEVAHHALHVLDSRVFGFNQALFEETGPADPPPEMQAAMIQALAGYPRDRGTRAVGQPRGRPRPMRRRRRVRVRARPDPRRTGATQAISVSGSKDRDSPAAAHRSRPRRMTSGSPPKP